LSGGGALQDVRSEPIADQLSDLVGECRRCPDLE